MQRTAAVQAVPLARSPACGEGEIFISLSRHAITRWVRICCNGTGGDGEEALVATGARDLCHSVYSRSDGSFGRLSEKRLVSR